MKFINKSTMLAFFSGVAVTLLITLGIYFIFLSGNSSAEVVTSSTPSAPVSSAISPDEPSSEASSEVSSEESSKASSITSSKQPPSSKPPSSTSAKKPESNTSKPKPPVIPQKPASSQNTSSTPSKPAPKPKDFRVVGYYPSWSPGKLDKIRYDVLTHINYAFAIPTSEGGLMPLENEETAKKIIASSHDNGIKVLLAVGGWSYNDVLLESIFAAAVNTEEKLKRFGDAIIEMCDKYGFDGIDMDWEYPRIENGSAANYEKLMVYLSEKLRAKGKLLTAAVICGVTTGGYDISGAKSQTQKVLEVVDWVNVMAYDGGDGELHSSYDFAVNSANYWRKTRGMPSEKVVLGVPFYSRPTWTTYDKVLASDPNAWNSDIAVINGIAVHYNGMDTIKKKTKFAKENLGGIMAWEITQDTSDKEKSLLTAILQAITNT